MALHGGFKSRRLKVNVIIHQTRLWWEMIERRKLEKNWHDAIDVVLPLCNVDIKWTQKRPVAIIVLVILIAAAVNFTVLHLIVWPQPSLEVTQCPLLSQLKSLFGWSLFPLVFWIIFPSLTLIENYSYMFLSFISVVWNSL